MDNDTYRAYYLLQYQRVADHETNRLAFTNFTLGASAIAFGFLMAAEQAKLWQVLLTHGGIVAVNLIAAQYTKRSRHWVKVHQDRAGAALTAFAKPLADLQEESDKAHKKGKLFQATRSQYMQMALHLLLAVVSLILFIVLATD